MKNGHGVTQDFKEVMIWYRKAVDVGAPMGMTSMGDLYRLPMAFLRVTRKL